MRFVSFALGLLTLQTGAQVPVPQLSPRAAYDQAAAPVDIIRRSLLNWSDIERSSLEAAIAQAKEACNARASNTYAGETLMDYARLCDLGQEWHPVLDASLAYIRSTDAAKPQLAEAYAFEVKALLNLKSEKSALAACEEMLRAIPYGPLPDEVTSTAVRYMQFAFVPDAIDLLTTRQPILLKLIAAPAATPAAVPLHTLVEHALDFAALEQYAGQARSARGIVEDIDAALPASLLPDEAILIDRTRLQYSLLGTKFPSLPGAVSLLPATGTPETQPKLGDATVFLLFPPWCAQCIRQAQQIVPALVGSSLVHGPEALDVHVYALLADKPPAAPTPPRPIPARTPRGPATSPVPEPEKTAAEQLRKTPTLVVAPVTLAAFNALDFPFLVATDRNGIIRLMVPAAPENALAQSGPIEQIAEHIITTWPAKATRP